MAGKPKETMGLMHRGLSILNKCQVTLTLMPFSALHASGVTRFSGLVKVNTGNEELVLSNSYADALWARQKECVTSPKSVCVGGYSLAAWLFLTLIASVRETKKVPH